MSRPTRGGFDLLGEARRSPREEPPSSPSADRPREEAWRADALARSRHSRLDELPRPGESFDQAAAETFCAELARKALGDFSPALLLLAAAERRRVQALAAYAFTLFDFARQRGVEGERLAQINRWQFTLEAALGGQPVGQPVFVAMAREHRRSPWPDDALDALAATARQRIGEPIPETAEAFARYRRRLAAALFRALSGADPPPGIAGLGAALLAVRGLVEVGEELRQRLSPLAAEELPPPWVAAHPPSAAEVLAAVRRRGDELGCRLASPPPELAALPAPRRRALTYLRLGALTLLARLEAGGEALLTTPPRLGLRDRLLLLARARWRGR